MQNSSFNSLFFQIAAALVNEVRQRVSLFKLRAKIQAERRELRDLDARLRADIGKSDAEVELEASRDFSDVPAHRLPGPNAKFETEKSLHAVFQNHHVHSSKC